MPTGRIGLSIAMIFGLSACAGHVANPSAVPSRSASASVLPSVDASAVASVLPSESSADEPSGASGLALIRQVDNVGQVFLVDGAGEARQITTFDPGTSFGGATSAAWSPDGTRMAVTLGVPVTVSVAIVEADDGESRMIDSAAFPAWAPDGSMLAVGIPFDAMGPGASETMPVSLIDPVSGNRHEIGFGLLPHWHPDGERIAVVRTVGETETDPGESVIVLLSVSDGTEEIHLRGASSVGWSADGSRVVWEPVSTACSGIDCHRLLVGDVATSAVIGEFIGAGQPHWSPDGERVAFTRQTHGAPEYAVADLESGEIASFGDANGGSLSWAPDGKRLALSVSDANGSTTTEVVDVQSGRILIELEGSGASWRPSP
ncbi:MAG: hypothetical protein ACRDG7_00815 [Candidatus Limnocylindria bacterium]